MIDPPPVLWSRIHSPPVPFTVLVVDDSEADRLLHALALRRWGLRTITASDGWEALVYARNMAPDLVVTDVRMPVLDGWGLLRRLRAAPETAGIPVILVTAQAPEVPARRAAEAGAAALVAKPLDFGVLRDAVARALPAGE